MWLNSLQDYRSICSISAFQDSYLLFFLVCLFFCTLLSSFLPPQHCQHSSLGNIRANRGVTETRDSHRRDCSGSALQCCRTNPAHKVLMTCILLKNTSRVKKCQLDTRAAELQMNFSLTALTLRSHSAMWDKMREAIGFVHLITTLKKATCIQSQCSH